MSLPLILISWTIIVLTGLLAIRLVRTAWKARSVPEGLMALFLGSGALGYAALMLRPTFGVPPEWERLVDDGARLLLLFPGMTIVLFTWYVFRRDAAWARLLAFGLAAFAVVTHVLSRWLAGPLGLGDAVSLEAGTSFFWLVTVLRASGFAWACTEASLYYRDAKRRVRLGLTEGAVANRFLLWAIWSGAATTMVGLRTLSTLLVDPSSAAPSTPVPILLGMFVAAIACAGGIWLTFAPPEFYRRLFAPSDPIPT